MTVYVDTSALLKRYLDEPDSDRAEDYLLGDPDWYTGRHTYVETRRNLFRAVEVTDRTRLREVFEDDWSRMSVIELDETTCRLAAEISELLGVRSLDALHLAAASRLGPSVLDFLTFDIRQAQAAKHLNFSILGV